MGNKFIFVLHIAIIILFCHYAFTISILVPSLICSTSFFHFFHTRYYLLMYSVVIYPHNPSINPSKWILVSPFSHVVSSMALKPLLERYSSPSMRFLHL